jgi:hypothetical protein
LRSTGRRSGPILPIHSSCTSTSPCPIAATEDWLRGQGATWLEDGDECPVWADPAGHPFCLHEDAAGGQQITGITLDSENNAALAAFYAEMLGMQPVETGWDGWLAISAGEYPDLAFARVAEHRQPRWPNPAYPQQMHLDINVCHPNAAGTAKRLGAVRLPDLGGSSPVYADPAGHPFCLCSPTSPSAEPT